MANKFSEITPQILELTQKCISNITINAELYGKYDVKRGLRDINGRGVFSRSNRYFRGAVLYSRGQ